MGSHVKSDNTHTQSFTYTPLHIYLTAWLAYIHFQQLSSIYSLPKPHHVPASHPSPGDNRQSTGEKSERTQGQGKMAMWNPISYIMNQGHPLFHIYLALSQSLHRHSSGAQGHLYNIHPPNLGLPRTRPPLTTASNTVVAVRYSSILSTCPNHLNTLWSALLANSLSIDTYWQQIK